MPEVYRNTKDEDYKFYKEWGFSEQDEAGNAKFQVGKDLVSMILNDGGVTVLKIGFPLANYSGGRWFQDYLETVMEVQVGVYYRVSIQIGAKHRKKPFKDGAHSEMRVVVSPTYTNKRDRPVMETNLVARIKAYLGTYEYKTPPIATAERAG